ncbi:ABC transporter permease [Virgibacillus proomii]|uniref:ABC transporter permease n=1 Tax=Virgibacillus proomii TaxID=84407 RepID=UPI002815C0F4|nr:ABC transporter permease [Virgibacillus proomii]
MLKLIQNEQAKIYIRKSSWVMYIILAAILIGFVFIQKNFADLNTEYQNDDWRQVLEDKNKKLEKEMKKDEFAAEINPLTIAKNNYYLENDIQPEPYDAWQFTKDAVLMVSSLAGLFTIIIAAGIVANEFNWGTIKLLLIRPISRSSILLSKYISILLFALYTLIFGLIFSWILGAIFFGVNGLNPSIVAETANGFKELAVVPQIFINYGYQLVGLVVMATFAFTISAVFRNGSLAIGVAIFLMMGSSTIVSFFLDKEWAKYILFVHTDLSQYAEGNEPMIEGMTLGFSITVLFVYYVIFMLLSWIVFTKRDVAGQ